MIDTIVGSTVVHYIPFAFLKIKPPCSDAPCCGERAIRLGLGVNNQRIFLNNTQQSSTIIRLS